MVNYICQLEWAEGCPDEGKNLVSGMSVSCFWKRQALELVDRVKNVTVQYQWALSSLLGVEKADAPAQAENRLAFLQERNRVTV